MHRNFGCFLESLNSGMLAGSSLLTCGEVEVDVHELDKTVDCSGTWHIRNLKPVLYLHTDIIVNLPFG